MSSFSFGWQKHSCEFYTIANTTSDIKLKIVDRVSYFVVPTLSFWLSPLASLSHRPFSVPSFQISRDCFIAARSPPHTSHNRGWLRRAQQCPRGWHNRGCELQYQVLWKFWLHPPPPGWGKHQEDLRWSGPGRPHQCWRSGDRSGSCGKSQIILLLHS